MVFHAGIVCYERNRRGQLVIYDTETKERTTKDVMAVGPGDNNGVEELFKSITNDFTGGKKGCLCICLGNRYDSEIRSKFVQTARSFGFTKVSITDWLSADFSDLVSKTDVFGTFKDVKGFIWIFCGKSVRVWRKLGEKAEFVKNLSFDDTFDGLKKMKESASEINKLPELVIYCNRYKLHYSKAEEVFGRDKVRVYTDVNQEIGVLLKARIMSGEPEMKKYATEFLLEWDVELKLGGTPIASAKTYQKLPYTGDREIVKPDGTKELEIFSYGISNKKYLPEVAKFTVKFKIDINGICIIDFDTGEPKPAPAAPKPKKEKRQQDPPKDGDEKPKFIKFQPPTPRNPGPRPQGSGGPRPGGPPQGGVVRTNLAKSQNKPHVSQSTSALNPKPRGAGKSGGRNNNGNQQPRGSSPTPSEPVHGFHLNNLPSPMYPYPPQQQPFIQYPQQGYPGYGMMHPGYPPNFAPPQFQQQFQNMGFASPPPYSEASASGAGHPNSFQTKPTQDYQRPAMDLGNSSNSGQNNHHSKKQQGPKR